jgi:hypothetical protein
MGRYKLVVLTNPAEGREDEFNAWYTGEHLSDVVAIPGFVSAQRLKLHSVTAGQFANSYLAIYEMDAENPEAAMIALTAATASGQMLVSESLDLDTVQCAVFEVCSPVVSASA